MSRASTAGWRSAVGPGVEHADTQERVQGASAARPATRTKGSPSGPSHTNTAATARGRPGRPPPAAWPPRRRSPEEPSPARRGEVRATEARSARCGGSGSRSGPLPPPAVVLGHSGLGQPLQATTQRGQVETGRSGPGRPGRRGPPVRASKMTPVLARAGPIPVGAGRGGLPVRAGARRRLPTSESATRMSAVEQTGKAPSASSALVPSEVALRIDPGTAPTGIPASAAASTVWRDPPWCRLSTTTTTSLKAASSRLRTGNRHFSVRHAGRRLRHDGPSVAPLAPTGARGAAGYGSSRPPATTPIGRSAGATGALVRSAVDARAPDPRPRSRRPRPSRPRTVPPRRCRSESAHGCRPAPRWPEPEARQGRRDRRGRRGPADRRRRRAG